MARQAVILAGGLGTRLGELTKSTPKPALSVGGRPFLLWLLAELNRFGVEQSLILAGFCADQIESIVAGRPEVEVLAEAEPLGTGGALRFARERLADRFYFLNGDSLFDINLLALDAILGDKLGVLSLRPVDDGARYGDVGLAGSTITAFRERPEKPGPSLINGGAALLTREILNWIPDIGVVSIEKDVFPHLASRRLLSGKVFDRPFIDIGVPEDYARAQTYIPDILRRGAVIFLGETMLIPDVVFAESPDQIRWRASAREAIRAVNEAGLLAFITVNRTLDSKGTVSEATLIALRELINEDLARFGAHIDALEYTLLDIEKRVPDRSRSSAFQNDIFGIVARVLARSNVDPGRCVIFTEDAEDSESARAAGVECIQIKGRNLRDLTISLISQLNH
ncbi:MAG TPA: sugar phosphate nucleotidyltransferase [Oculatellaceae cyanobacterium]